MKVLHIEYANDEVQMLDRKMSEDGYCWYRVRFTASKAVGWVRADFFFPHLD